MFYGQVFLVPYFTGGMCRRKEVQLPRWREEVVREGREVRDEEVEVKGKTR